MVNVSKETEKNIAQLQMLEQNIQSFLSQKQQFQSQIIEFESALDEIDKTDISYRIIGNVMVKVDKEDLKKDITEKKDVAELRIKTIEKQEDSLREKAKELQKKVMDGMKEEE